jgi:hypothetical protein
MRVKENLGNPPRSTAYITVPDLLAAGLTPEQVRRCCPLAAEYTGADRRPCWLREDLACLLVDAEQGSDA